jgi:large subunit ribosomal protein L10
LKKTDKEKIVADLHQRLTRSQAVFVTDFTGLNVESINKLRRDLKQRGDEYRVVKKTLLRRASQETPVSAIEDLLVGPCGITISYGDPVASAKLLADFAKDREISAADVGQLAKMPSREIILGQLLSALVAVPTGLVSTLSAIIQKFLLTLKAVEDQKAQA